MVVQRFAPNSLAIHHVQSLICNEADVLHLSDARSDERSLQRGVYATPGAESQR